MFQQLNKKPEVTTLFCSFFPSQKWLNQKNNKYQSKSNIETKKTKLKKQHVNNLEV